MVLLANEKPFPAVAPGHHMIHRASILESLLPRHAPTMPPASQRCQARIFKYKNPVGERALDAESEKAEN
jgi:hypothetical protein